MNVRVVRLANEMHVQIQGRFCFDDRHTFNRALEPVLAEGGVGIVIDLSRVDYLDSAALSLLLILRDKARTARRPIALIRSPGVASQILDVARFDALFELRDAGPRA